MFYVTAAALTAYDAIREVGTMPDWLPDYVTSYVLPIGGAVVALIGWIRAEVLRRRAEARERATEKELADVSRRADGPFFVACYMTYPNCGYAVVRGAAVPVTLSIAAELTVVLRNSGHSVRSVELEMPIGYLLKEASSWRKLNLPLLSITAGNESYLYYKYDPAQRGKNVIFRVNFETASGLKLHHVYETRHGFCEIRRVDPV